MPICRTKGEGVTGLGITTEIPDSELAKMTAGQVFERLSMEFWSDFYRMAGIEPGDEDLEATYQRSFLEKARIIH